MQSKIQGGPVEQYCCLCVLEDGKKCVANVKIGNANACGFICLRMIGAKDDATESTQVEKEHGLPYLLETSECEKDHRETVCQHWKRCVYDIKYKKDGVSHPESPYAACKEQATENTPLPSACNDLDRFPRIYPSLKSLAKIDRYTIEASALDSGKKEWFNTLVWFERDARNRRTALGEGVPGAYRHQGLRTLLDRLEDASNMVSHFLARPPIGNDSHMNDMKITLNGCPIAVMRIEIVRFSEDGQHDDDKTITVATLDLLVSSPVNIQDKSFGAEGGAHSVGRDPSVDEKLAVRGAGTLALAVLLKQAIENDVRLVTGNAIKRAQSFYDHVATTRGIQVRGENDMGLRFFELDAATISAVSTAFGDILSMVSIPHAKVKRAKTKDAWHYFCDEGVLDIVYPGWEDAEEDGDGGNPCQTREGEGH